MWFIGVEVEQETSAPPLKKNPGSAPGSRGNGSGTGSLGKINIPITGISILSRLPVPLLLITCNGKDHFVLCK